MNSFTPIVIAFAAIPLVLVVSLLIGKALTWLFFRGEERPGGRTPPFSNWWGGGGF